MCASGSPEAGQGLGRRAEWWHSRRIGMIVVGLTAGAAARGGKRYSAGCCLSRWR